MQNVSKVEQAKTANTAERVASSWPLMHRRAAVRNVYTAHVLSTMTVAFDRVTLCVCAPLTRLLCEFSNKKGAGWLGRLILKVHVYFLRGKSCAVLHDVRNCSVVVPCIRKSLVAGGGCIQFEANIRVCTYHIMLT